MPLDAPVITTVFDMSNCVLVYNRRGSATIYCSLRQHLHRLHALRQLGYLLHQRVNGGFDILPGMLGGNEETQPRRFGWNGGIDHGLHVDAAMIELLRENNRC